MVIASDRVRRDSYGHCQPKRTWTSISRLVRSCGSHPGRPAAMSPLVFSRSSDICCPETRGGGGAKPDPNVRADNTSESVTGEQRREN